MSPDPILKTQPSSISSWKHNNRSNDANINQWEIVCGSELEKYSPLLSKKYSASINKRPCGFSSTYITNINQLFQSMESDGCKKKYK